jgi:hypothetical protein
MDMIRICEVRIMSKENEFWEKSFHCHGNVFNGWVSKNESK